MGCEWLTCRDFFFRILFWNWGCGEGRIAEWDGCKGCGKDTNWQNQQPRLVCWSHLKFLLYGCLLYASHFFFKDCWFFFLRVKDCRLYASCFEWLLVVCFLVHVLILYNWIILSLQLATLHGVKNKYYLGGETTL